MNKVFYLDNNPVLVTTVQQLNPQRETVHRLQIKPGSLQSHIPPNASTVIVKQKKEEWDQEFEDEKIAYQRLSTIQGDVITQFYGEGMYNDLPAIFLSDISGRNLHDLAHSTSEVQETALRAELEKAMKILYDLGAEYWDQKLDNFILSDSGRIVIIDLEQVQFPESLDPWERHINLGGVGYLIRRFRGIRAPENQKAYNKWKVGYANKGNITPNTLHNKPAEVSSIMVLPDE